MSYNTSSVLSCFAVYHLKYLTAITSGDIGTRVPVLLTSRSTLHVFLFIGDFCPGLVAWQCKQCACIAGGLDKLSAPLQPLWLYVHGFHRFLLDNCSHWWKEILIFEHHFRHLRHVWSWPWYFSNYPEEATFEFGRIRFLTNLFADEDFNHGLHLILCAFDFNVAYERDQIRHNVLDQSEKTLDSIL